MILKRLLQYLFLLGFVSVKYSVFNGMTEWLLCSLYEERKKLGGIFKQSIATSVLFQNHVIAEQQSEQDAVYLFQK